MTVLRVRVSFGMVISVPVLNNEAWRDIVMVNAFSERCVAELNLIRYLAARVLVMCDDTRN